MESDDNRGGEGLGSKHIDWRNNFDEKTLDTSNVEKDKFGFLEKTLAGTFLGTVGLIGLVIVSGVGGCTGYAICKDIPPDGGTAGFYLGASTGVAVYFYGIYKIIKL